MGKPRPSKLLPPITRAKRAIDFSHMPYGHGGDPGDGTRDLQDIVEAATTARRPWRGAAGAAPPWALHRIGDGLFWGPPNKSRHGLAEVVGNVSLEGLTASARLDLEKNAEAIVIGVNAYYFGKALAPYVGGGRGKLTASEAASLGTQSGTRGEVAADGSFFVVLAENHERTFPGRPFNFARIPTKRDAENVAKQLAGQNPGEGFHVLNLVSTVSASLSFKKT